MGQIKYQGQAINKFYIEGRYAGWSLWYVTNTINPDDVGSVEVMENHQPIKALEDIFLSNLQLIFVSKRMLKSRWVGTATLSATWMPSLLFRDGQVNLRDLRRRIRCSSRGKHQCW